VPPRQEEGRGEEEVDVEAMREGKKWTSREGETK